MIEIAEEESVLIGIKKTLLLLYYSFFRPSPSLVTGVTIISSLRMSEGMWIQGKKCSATKGKKRKSDEGSVSLSQSKVDMAGAVALLQIA